MGQEDLLEKKMATHPNILAWEIPWIEEADRLQSMGSKRVEHKLATKKQTKKLLIYPHRSYMYTYIGT